MRKYTKEQLIFYLKKLSFEIKKTPTIRDLNSKKKYPSSSTYFARFKTWNNSLKEAGLKINARKEYEKKELLENIKLLVKELGRLPKAKDLKNRDWAGSYSTYRKHFGSWEKALKEAHLNKAGISDLKKFSKK